MMILDRVWLNENVILNVLNHENSDFLSTNSLDNTSDFPFSLRTIGGTSSLVVIGASLTSMTLAFFLFFTALRPGFAGLSSFLLSFHKSILYVSFLFCMSLYIDLPYQLHEFNAWVDRNDHSVASR